MITNVKTLSLAGLLMLTLAGCTQTPSAAPAIDLANNYK